MYLNNKKGDITKYWSAVSDFLSLASRFGGGEVGEHVLDLRHIGHDVLHQHQGSRVVQLALSFLSQDILVAAEETKYEF